jgi:hypothetical protein
VGTWRWPVVAVVVVALLTAGGSWLARDRYLVATQPVRQAVLPGDGELSPDEQPGSRSVEATADATTHPLYETVRQLLQTYFDAINGKRYDRWKTTVSKRRIEVQPQDDWEFAYRSSRDGSIVVYRIESGPTDSARVMLGFTSVQDPQDAPLELPVDCIRWRVIFPLTVEDGTWKLDSGPTAASPQHEEC